MLTLRRSLFFKIALGLVVAAGVVKVYRYALRQRAAAMAQEIESLVASGDGDAAIDRLQRYLTILPQDHERLGLLARLLIDRTLEGKADPRSAGFARDTLRIALARAPENHELRERLVLLLLAVGEPEAALRHLEMLRVYKPETAIDEDATRRIGILHAKAALATGRGAESRDALRRLTEFAPGAPVPPGRREAFAMLAVMLAEGLNQHGAAQDVLERMTVAYPEDAEAWKILAAWHLDHRHPEAAAAATARAVALAPLDQGALLLDASAALGCGERARAEALLAGPLADAPLSKTLVTSRAALAAGRGDVEGMAGILRSGIESLPDDRSLLVESLVVLVDAGRLDDVRELLPAARRLLGADAGPILYAEATIDTDERRWLSALKTWERLGTTLDGDPARARRIAIAQATCHSALGQTDRAAAARRRATATDPRSLTAVALEAVNLEEAGKPEEALTLLERSTASRPVEAILAVPAVWQALLRLRIAEQARLPPERRDWTATETLLAAVEADAAPPAAADAFRIRILEAKLGPEAAVEAARAAAAARPDDPRAAATLLTLLARLGRTAVAAECLESLPEDIRATAEVLAAQSTLAAMFPAATRDAMFADVERRARSLAGADGNDVRRRLAILEAVAGRDDEAGRIAAAVVADDPEDLETRELLLELAVERRDEGAVAEHARAIEALVGPDSPQGRIARVARIVAEAGSARAAAAPAGAGTFPVGVDESLVEADGMLAAAAQEMPSSPDVERRLAEVAAARGDVAGAIGHLRRATALRESVPWSQRRLARTLVAAGRTAEAVPVIAALAAAGTGGAPVGRLQADLLAATGRRGDALELGARLTPPDCRDPDQLAWYASLLSRLAPPADAEAACRRAIAAATERPSPRLTLLALQWRGGKRKDAAATVRAALAELDGGARDLFERRAAAIVGTEDRLERRYRAAADAGDPRARRTLAEYLLAAGRTSEARTLLEALVRGADDHDVETTRWARRRLASVLARSPTQADLQEALRLLEANSGAGGMPLPEDTALAAAFLVRRGDPASWRRALSFLDRIEETRGLTVDERVLRADVRRRFGGRQRERAREDLTAIADSPERSVAVFGMLVGMALEDEDPASARQWLDRLRALAPETPLTLHLSTRVAVAEGDGEAASRTAAVLVPQGPLTPGNETEMVARAALAEQAGFADAARPVFAAAASLGVQGRLQWARFLGRTGQTAEAIEALEPARGRCSPIVLLETLVAIAAAADEAGLAEALPRVDALAAALRRENPGASDVALQLALLADVVGREQEATAAYRSLLADDGSPPVGRAIAAGNLALHLALPATAAEAESLVEGAIATLGPLPDLLDTRALARAARGETTLAREDVADAALQPSARRHLHAAFVHAAAGDLGEARAALGRADALGLRTKRLSTGDVARRRVVEGAIAAADGEG